MNVKHNFPDTLTNIEIGNLLFDEVSYDEELIVLTNTENPDITLRFDCDRRDIFLYQTKGEFIEVNRWVIFGNKVDERRSSIPREKINMEKNPPNEKEYV